MAVVQWEKQCIYAIIWVINEVQNHKPDFFLNLMSDSPALTEDWTLPWMLTGFVHQQISRLWAVFRMFIPVFCHTWMRESCSALSEWKSQFLLKEQEERIFSRGPHISIFFGLKGLTSTHSTWACTLPAYSVIPPDQVSPGRAGRFSRSLQAFAGIF